MLPHTPQEGLVCITGQRKNRENVERLPRSFGVHLSAQHIAAQHLSDFDVDQVWCIQRLLAFQEPGAYRTAVIRLQQDFDYY